MKRMRLASLDYGQKRIGIAISDERQCLASPLDTITEGKSLEEKAHAVALRLQSYTLEKVLLGYPRHMNGEPGTLAEEVLLFQALLEKALYCPILLVDERLSSVQAERALTERGMSRKARAKVVDAMSALLLLQGYLGY